MTTIERFGWSAAWQDQFDEWSLRGCVPARVIRQEYGAWLLAAEDREEWARQARRGLCIVTGDWVAVQPDFTRIEGVLERSSVIERKAAGRRIEAQVLAANVDAAFIVMGLDGDYNLARLQRYLALARSSHVRPVVVLNKRDLSPGATEALARTRAVSGGAEVVLVSATQDDVAASLFNCAASRETVALLGSSGAGKSTIINRLQGFESQATAAVRAGDSRGRHTTTTRQLLALGSGWLLMDLPGLREVLPWNLAPNELSPGKFRDEVQDLERKRQGKIGQKAMRAWRRLHHRSVGSETEDLV